MSTPIQEDGANSRAVERLLRALRTSSIVPFVGAGCSIPYRHPGWTDFLHEEAREAGIEAEVRKCLDSTPAAYEEAAQLLYEALGHLRFEQDIKDAYGDEAQGEPAGATAVHYLPALTQGPVLTTNFDHVLETYFSSVRCPFQAVVWGAGDASLRWKALGENRRYLIKLHGDVEDDQERVLTLDQYRLHYEQSPHTLTDVLRDLITRKSLLFIGCSLNADRLVGILHEATRQRQTLAHFALVPRPSDTQDRLERARFLGNHSIDPLWFTPGDYEAIPNFLDFLIRSTAVDSVLKDYLDAEDARDWSAVVHLGAELRSRRIPYPPDPRRAAAHVNLGNKEVADGNFLRALIQYRNADTLAPGIRGLHAALVIAYIGQGLYDDALAELHRAEESGADRVLITGLRARIALLTEDYSTVLSDTTSLLDLGIEDHQLLEMRSLANLMSHDTDASIRDALRVRRERAGAGRLSALVDGLPEIAEVRSLRELFGAAGMRLLEMARTKVDDLRSELAQGAMRYLDQELWPAWELGSGPQAALNARPPQNGGLAGSAP